MKTTINGVADPVIETEKLFENGHVSDATAAGMLASRNYLVVITALERMPAGQIVRLGRLIECVLLNNRNALVRAAAVYALKRTRSGKHRQMFRRLLTRSRSPSLRIELCHALLGGGDVEYGGVLIGYLSHSDYRIRTAAAHAMTILDENFCKDAIPALRAGLAREKSRAAREAMKNTLNTLRSNRRTS